MKKYKKYHGDKRRIEMCVAGEHAEFKLEVLERLL